MKGSSWEGATLPNPPTGGGVGKPGFPISLRESQALPRAGAWGDPVSPSPCVRARPSHGRGRGETRFPHLPARAAIRCNEGDGPLPSPPPLGEGVRRLPPAGGGWEGGCGAACANVKISPRRGGWGNRVSPYLSGRGPEARAPRPRPLGGCGRAQPSQEVCSSRRCAAEPHGRLR